MFFKRFTSSIGRKAVMAATGLCLVAFVIVHMAGNLQIFLGPDALNGYAEHLQKLPVLLWPARLLLFFILVLHIAVSISLAIENKRARPLPYACERTVQASYASRTLVASGSIILLFVVYHLLNFTFGVTHPQYYHLVDGKGRHDVYSMVVLSFHDLFVSGSYVAAMLVLCFHLSHGIQSLFQSLGLNGEGTRPIFEKLAQCLAIIIFLGNSSIPVAALMGLLRLPKGIG